MDRFDLLQFEDAQQMFERRAKEAESRKKKFADIESLGYCEGFTVYCYCKDELSWVYPRTSFSWDKDKYPHNDPNRKIFLCRNCAEACESYWYDQWQEYYSGLL